MLLRHPNRGGNIPSKMYSLLIDTYIKNLTKKLQLLHAIKTVPCIQCKANWALKWRQVAYS
jgi:hypothetical protein